MSRGGARIPNADRAAIDSAKLRDYLLSPQHPVGRFKAAFFAQLGYRQDNWQMLAADLRTQHLTRDAREWPASRHGRKFEIRAPLRGPNGQTLDVVSVWMIRVLEDMPRFVTAYPGEGR